MLHGELYDATNQSLRRSPTSLSRATSSIVCLGAAATAASSDVTVSEPPIRLLVLPPKSDVSPSFALVATTRALGATRCCTVEVEGLHMCVMPLKAFGRWPAASRCDLRLCISPRRSDYTR